VRGMRIKVSYIPIYLKCQRMFRLLAVGHEYEVDVGLLLHLAQKEWGLRYPRILKEFDGSETSELEKLLLKALAGVKHDISHIHSVFRDVEKEDFEQVFQNLEKRIPEISCNLVLVDARSIFPVQTDVFLSSKEISGVVDKIVIIDGSYAPSLIKTHHPPSIGVWKADRLQATAYAMLLEDEMDIRIEKAQIEYVSCGIARDFPVKTADRRNVINCLEDMKATLEQERDNRNEKMCGGCPLRKICKWDDY